MDALQYLNIHIVGQERLKPELSLLMEEIKHGNNFNLLIRGSSGYGKTKLARRICAYADKEHSQIILGERGLDDVEQYRINILDEAHEISNPEYLYPIMDNGEHTFLILTNEFDDLKEPFQNRCIQFTLFHYTNEELAILVDRTLRKHQIRLSSGMCLVVASYSRGNPRVAKILSKRLAILIQRVGVPINIEQLEEFLLMYFNIHKEGYTEFDKVYLQFLKDNGVTGIDTISRILCIPKQTIQTEIEPFLIKKNKIRITPRGRIYIGDQNAI